MSRIILLWRWCHGLNAELVYSTYNIQGGWLCLRVEFDENKDPFSTYTYNISEII